MCNALPGHNKKPKEDCCAKTRTLWLSDRLNIIYYRWAEETPLRSDGDLV